MVDIDGQLRNADLILSPELTVFRASHSFLVRDWEGNVSTYPDDDPVALLWAIAESLVSLGSKYDAQRLYIGTRPGHKHHDLHPKPCADCECGCDPDQSTPE